MPAKIQVFLDTLIMYDYILFTVSFAFFILFIILGIILRKRIGLTIFFIFIAFLILIGVPTLVREQMHMFLFSNTTALVSQKRLEFTQAIVVKGSLENTSKVDFKRCRITANVHKLSKNPLKNYLFQFTTIKKMSIVEEDILKASSRNFKILIEPFTYSRDYNITLGASCR